MLTNRFVGNLRMRQLRVQPNGNCEITPDLRAEWQFRKEVSAMHRCPQRTVESRPHARTTLSAGAGPAR